MLKIKQVSNHSTLLFNAVYLPKYAVYTLIKPHNGTPFYVWIDDITAVCNKKIFTVSYLSAGEKTPKSTRRKAAHGEVERALVAFIMNLPTDRIHIPIEPFCAQKQDLRAAAPKDRTIPAPIMRGRPDPSPLTQRFVTDGCRIGSRFYTEEAYWDRLK